MDKIDLILNLVRENKITNEEAKTLLANEQPYIVADWTYRPYNTTGNPYTVTCGSSSTCSNQIIN